VMLIAVHPLWESEQGQCVRANAGSARQRNRLYSETRLAPLTFLEIFTLFASGIAIFGLIVGLFSIWNGRMTRREITAVIRETHEATTQLIRETRESTAQLIRETQQLIAQEAQATRQLIREIHEATRPILERITEILARIEERVRRGI